MTEECLLQELERWRDPNTVPGNDPHVLVAVQSAAHQKLAARFRRALTNAPVRAPDLPLPPPC